MDTHENDSAQEPKLKPRSLPPWRESADGALLTVPGACAYLKSGKDTVRRLYESGAITSIKVGGSRRIVKASVDAWIAKQAAEASAA